MFTRSRGVVVFDEPERGRIVRTNSGQYQSFDADGRRVGRFTSLTDALGACSQGVIESIEIRLQEMGGSLW